jgi:hypothetical protein
LSWCGAEVDEFIARAETSEIAISETVLVHVDIRLIDSQSVRNGPWWDTSSLSVQLIVVTWAGKGGLCG